jgi:DNA-binding XRE family transcriptional regulator
MSPGAGRSGTSVASRRRDLTPSVEIREKNCDLPHDPAMRLSHLREAAGKTRAEVASDLGIDEQELEQLELMTVLPDRWVPAFAAYYSVDEETFENGADL